jgi:SPP1 gp7 family putative phage head morphogenesis protein
MNNQNWRVTKLTEHAYWRDIVNLLNSAFAEGGDPTERARILSRSEFLGKYAWQAAQRMITSVYSHNARTWKEAARQANKSPEIYELLQQEMNGAVGTRVHQLVAENARLIRSLPEDVARQVSQELLTAQQEGRRAENLTTLVPRVAKWKAQLIARTETSKATTALTQARSEALGIRAYVWRTSEDQRVRLAHRKMEGVIVMWDDPPSPERLLGEKNAPAPYQAGNVWNCFTGDTLVNRNYCEQILRTWYDGTVVDIKLNSTASFSATLNHPILTMRGWVPAGALDKSDKLPKIGSDDRFVLENNNQEELISFSDLYCSLSSRTATRTIPALRFNFYGEIPINEVNAITSNHDLSFNGFRQSADYKIFSSPDGVVRFPFVGVQSQIPETNFLGFENVCSSFFNGKSRHSDAVSFANSSQSNTVPFQQFENSWASDSDFPSDGHGTISGEVIFDDFILRESYCPMSGSLSSRYLNTVREHGFGKTGDVELFGDSFVGYPTFNKTLDIIEIKRRKFSGHVYTLQSPTGYYTVSTSGIGAKNCRCYPESLLRFDQISWPHRVYSNGRITSMTLAQFKRLNNFTQPLAA